VRVLPSKRHPLSLTTRAQAVAVLHHAGLLELLVETPIAAICSFICESLITAKRASRSGLDLTKIMNFMFGSGVDVASVCHVVN